MHTTRHRLPRPLHAPTTQPPAAAVSTVAPRAEAPVALPGKGRSRHAAAAAALPCTRRWARRGAELPAARRPACTAAPPARAQQACGAGGARQRPRQAAPATRSAPDDAPPQLTAQTDTEQLLQQLDALKRQLEEAVAQEDYAAAKRLKEQSDAVKQQLPPVHQFMLHQCERLRAGSAEDKRAAIKALGDVGDAACLPDLASCLNEPQLNAPACDAMWAVFHRHPNRTAQELVERGVKMLQASQQYSAALAVFDQACRIEPSFAEAHNKRATVLYLMQRFEESIDACRITLDLNPHHFGAASGMGMCCLGLDDHAGALAAFELALSINPALDPIQTYAAALRAKLADDAAGGGGKAGGGGGGGGLGGA